MKLIIGSLLKKRAVLLEKKAMDEWRRYERGHPPSGRVLVHTEFGEIVSADFAAGYWWRSGGTQINAQVTHWMPLPEPPVSTVENGAEG